MKELAMKYACGSKTKIAKDARQNNNTITKESFISNHNFSGYLRNTLGIEKSFISNGSNNKSMCNRDDSLIGRGSQSKKVKNLNNPNLMTAFNLSMLGSENDRKREVDPNLEIQTTLRIHRMANDISSSHDDSMSNSKPGIKRSKKRPLHVYQQEGC